MFHSLDICQRIGEKLKDPSFVAQTASTTFDNSMSSEEKWAEFSPVHGWPGLALFYSVMDSAFPGEGWDRTAHQYLSISISILEERGFSDLSLYQGLSGLCFITYCCSRNEERYHILLSKLDQLLIEHLEKRIRLQDLNKIEPSFYNLMEGLSGILLYLILRQDNPLLLKWARECLMKIIYLMNQEHCIDGHYLSGWFTLPDNDFVTEMKHLYPKGRFILSTPFGVAGVLSVLSIAFYEGLRVDQLQETIFHLAEWLKKRQQLSPFGPAWYHSISYEKEVGIGEDPDTLSRDSWCYGIPSITLSLYLASKALKTPVLGKFAEDTLLSMFSKPEKEWNLMGPSFVLGRSGLLATLFCLNREIKNPLLVKKIDYLENDLKRFFDMAHPFGFCSVDISAEGEYRWVNNPGLLDGAAGIALSLLLLHSRATDTCKWERMFLLG